MKVTIGFPLPSDSEFLKYSVMKLRSQMGTERRQVIASVTTHIMVSTSER